MTEDTRRLSPLAEHWAIIAHALDLRIVAPFSTQLPSGHRLDADVLLMDFGASRGMLLVTDDDAVWTHRDAISSAGYGFSVLSDPGPTSPEDVVLQEVFELLRDWGWTGSGPQPAWLDAP